MNGVIFYQGPSRIDKEPIVGIATGLKNKSKNIKTGDLIQTWIFNDNDLTPLQNAKSNGSASVCGNCKHAPYKRDGEYILGSCYVRLDTGPSQVYVAYINGKYEILDKKHFKYFNNRVLRLGSFGNPSAIPIKVWKKLISLCDSYLGYEHLWNKKLNSNFKQYCMASVDSEEEKKEANDLGWRTFRVKLPTESALADEVVCPASVEAGKLTTCENCLLCMGTGKKAKNVVIDIHGLPYRKNRFEEVRKLISLPMV